MTTKECSSCKKPKSIDLYMSTSNRELSTCIDCRNIAKTWRDKNKQHLQDYRDKTKERTKTYYDANVNKIIAQQSEYKKNNPNKLKETRTSYYQRNKEIIKEKRDLKSKEKRLNKEVDESVGEAT